MNSLEIGTVRKIETNAASSYSNLLEVKTPLLLNAFDHFDSKLIGLKSKQKTFTNEVGKSRFENLLQVILDRIHFSLIKAQLIRCRIFDIFSQII